MNNLSIFLILFCKYLYEGHWFSVITVVCYPQFILLLLLKLLLLLLLLLLEISRNIVHIILLLFI